MKLDRGQAARRAARLAELSPVVNANPRVGCVIVSTDGTVLAEGYHRGAGTPHAEAAAIDEATDRGVDLRGSIAYVTLEPCAHQGRTPSCAQALVRAGVATVVYGQADANGAASGGAGILREAGVHVESDDELARGSECINAEWTFSVAHGRPFVRWKFAATLDGYSAAADGTSQWITATAARADVHRLRAQHGAVVVGTGTVLADDPHLTVRDTYGDLLPDQPLRVVVGDSEVPRDARVLDDAAPTVHLRGHEPAAVLADLHARGVHSVWLEGGPRLAAAFLRAGMVDEVIAYFAPALLGGGRSAVGDLDASSISDLRRFALLDVTTLTSPCAGDASPQTDLRLTLRPLVPDQES